MYCTQCGTHNDDDARHCRHCKAELFVPGRSDPGRAYPARIPNYLVQSILVTLCCCVPVGIVAIVYSAQVDGLARAGNIAGAKRCSRLAYVWAWVAFGVGLALGLAYLFFTVLGSVLA
jgi:hypothetical protein